MAIKSGKYDASEIRHLFHLQAEAIASAAASGYNISTELCHVQPIASGIVTEEELSAPLNHQRVKVYASTRPGKTLKEAMATTKLNLLAQHPPPQVRTLQA